MATMWKAPDGLFANPDNVRSVFEAIYDLGVWGGGSGAGSAPHATKRYVSLVQSLLNTNPIRSVVDIGCGDWQFSQFIQWGEAKYVGIDVVRGVIEANQRRFAAANISFLHADPLEDPSVVPAGDLLLMKDVLQHLSNKNAASLLKLTARFKISLITNDYAPANEDCANGDTRPLDIRAAPFDLKHALFLVPYEGKAVFLVVNMDPFGL